MRINKGFSQYPFPNLLIFALFASSIALSTSDVSAVPSGPTWEDSYEMNLDRTEYKPGDAVTIDVINTFYTGSEPIVTIRKATSDEGASDQNLDVVYHEQKQLMNGTVEFVYRIPLEGNGLLIGNVQRYVVILNEPYYGDTPVKTVFFTVKDEADVIFPLLLGVGAVISGTVTAVLVMQ